MLLHKHAESLIGVRKLDLHSAATFFLLHLSMTLVPLLVIGVLSIPLVVSRLWKMSISLFNKLRALYTHTVLLLVFLIYPAVSKQVCELGTNFMCKRIDVCAVPARMRVLMWY